jgi:hypothetical protein
VHVVVLVELESLDHGERRLDLDRGLGRGRG